MLYHFLVTGLAPHQSLLFRPSKHYILHKYIYIYKSKNIYMFIKIVPCAARAAAGRCPYRCVYSDITCCKKGKEMGTATNIYKPLL
jgi:hypothetical protein